MDLYQAKDAEDSYAITIGQKGPPSWRAERGLGNQFEKAWTVELQSDHLPDLDKVDWEAVLERVIEAYDLNDPVVTDFQWPLRLPA